MMELKKAKSSPEEMYRVIRDYILKRQEDDFRVYKTRPAAKSSSEGSCCTTNGGEVINLLEQLTRTLEGYGDWNMLRHPELLEACYERALRIQEFREWNRKKQLEFNPL